MSDIGSKAPAKTEKSGSQPASSGVWHPLEQLHQEIDHLFEDLGRGFPRFGRHRFDLKPFWTAASDLAPAVDVVDKGNTYQITAELPGLDEKNVEITIADDVLTIKGEKKEEKEERQKDYYRSERRFGAFQRSFELPVHVDQGKVEANFHKGVLTITLPKTEEAQQKTKKIPITAK